MQRPTTSPRQAHTTSRLTRLSHLTSAQPCSNARPALPPSETQTSQARLSPLLPSLVPVRCLTRSRNRHVWPVRRRPARGRQGERSEAEGPHRQLLHHYHCRRRPRTPQAAGASPHWPSLQAHELTPAPHPPPPARRPPHPPLRGTRQGARKAACQARQARRGATGTPQGEGGAVQGG